MDIYFFHAWYRLLPVWKRWIYCYGAVNAEKDVLEKLQHFLDIKKTDHVTYMGGLDLIKYPYLSNYFFHSLKRKIPIYYFYNVFVEYVVGRIDEVWNAFSLYK